MYLTMSHVQQYNPISLTQCHKLSGGMKFDCAYDSAYLFTYPGTVTTGVTTYVSTDATSLYRLEDSNRQLGYLQDNAQYLKQHTCYNLDFISLHIYML